MNPGFRKVCSIFLIFLSATFGLATWMRFIRQAFPGLPPAITPAHYQGVIAETNPWLEPWQRWDTLHLADLHKVLWIQFDKPRHVEHLYISCLICFYS